MLSAFLMILSMWGFQLKSLEMFTPISTWSWWSVRNNSVYSFHVYPEFSDFRQQRTQGEKEELGSRHRVEDKRTDRRLLQVVNNISEIF